MQRNLDILSKRQREVLVKMVSEDEELVYERGTGYVGLERVSASTVSALLRLCAISLDQFSEVGKFERYHINDTGKELLR